MPHRIPPTSQSKRSSLRSFSISGQGRRRRPEASAPGPTAKILPKASREGPQGEGRAQGSESRVVPKAANRFHTSSQHRAELMTNTGCDGRTRSPRLHDSTCRAARGSPGPSPARLASRLLRSRHPRSSATASVRGLRRSEAAGSGPVSLSGGACGPPLPLLPRWPRAPLLRGESRWRRLWLCEEDGRGGGVEKATSKRSQEFSGGQKRSESPGKCYLVGFGCSKREERSGGSGCSGWARYKEGKHGGGGLRRRRRGKRLCGGHGGGRSRAVNRPAPCLNGGPVGCAVLSVPVGAAGRPRSLGLDNSAEERETREGGGPGLGPGSGPCERRRSSAAASGGTEVSEAPVYGRPLFLDTVPGPLGRGPRSAR